MKGRRTEEVSGFSFLFYGVFSTGKGKGGNLSFLASYQQV